VPPPAPKNRLCPLAGIYLSFHRLRSEIMKAITQKPLKIQVGSDIHNPTGGHFVPIPTGETISLEDSRGMSCNVWITWQGQRGKIECGEIRNLTRDGSINLL